MTQMFAHLTKTRTGFELLYSATPDLRGTDTRLAIKVASKREARKLCAGNGATPWNF